MEFRSNVIETFFAFPFLLFIFGQSCLIFYMYLRRRGKRFNDMNFLIHKNVFFVILFLTMCFNFIVAYILIELKMDRCTAHGISEILLTLDGKAVNIERDKCYIKCKGLFSVATCTNATLLHDSVCFCS